MPADFLRPPLERHPVQSPFGVRQLVTFFEGFPRTDLRSFASVLPSFYLLPSRRPPPIPRQHLRFHGIVLPRPRHPLDDSSFDQFGPALFSPVDSPFLSSRPEDQGSIRSSNSMTFRPSPASDPPSSLLFTPSTVFSFFFS